MRRALTIGVLGLAGLAVAVAITMAASNLSSQSIGLSDEPLDAGDALAVPPPAATRTPRPQATRDAAPKATTAPQVTTAPHVTTDPRTTGDGVQRGTPSQDDRSGSGRTGSDDSGGRSGSDDSGGDD